jgi:ketosteroid isomerase-like protein
MAEDLQQATTALVDALGRGDAAAAAALYAADGKLLTPAAELIAGRRQIEAYWRAGIAFGLSRLEFHAAELEVVDGIAIELGRYVLALTGDGAGTVCDRGKYLVLHRRETDGSWRRAVDVFNPDVPEAARRNRKEEQ